MSQLMLSSVAQKEATITRAHLRRILRITERQLRAWERQGWVRSEMKSAAADGRACASAGHPCFSFADIATLRLLLRLRQSGISSSGIRWLQSAIREGLLRPDAGTGLSDLQVQSHGGRRLSVRYHGARMEPLTGQFLLDFAEPRKSSAVRSLDLRRRREPTEAERRARADRFFLAGLRYEERAETLPKAVRAYQKATHLNPRALGAFINLGTIYYHQGHLDEAERSYQSALALNPRSALVHFNLGNLVEERGQWERARDHYEEAIRLDPAYPDPRFNLALVYERLGRHGRALQQWRNYLKLDSSSRWATYARQKLQQAPLQIVPSAKAGPKQG
jgi:tetratricopeptide (TPR) repeat protein